MDANDEKNLTTLESSSALLISVSVHMIPFVILINIIFVWIKLHFIKRLIAN